MKLTCQIIQDLLPLYEDGVCSPESRQAVESHLRDCPACAKKLQTVRQLEIPVPEKSLPEKAAVRGLRRLRRRWALSLVAVLVLLPVLTGLGWLCRNEVRKEGICFTNLDEAALAGRFGKLLEDGEFAEAAAYLDDTEDYESTQEALSSTWEDDLPNLTPITVEGESWMADPQIASEFGGSEDFWHDLIYGGHYHFLLYPEDAFLAVAEQDPQGLCADPDGTYYLTDGNASFLLLELDWGSFYVTESNWLDVYKIKDDPVSLCYSLDLVPQALYTQTLPALEENAKELWQSTQDWNEPYRGMTLAEYNARQQGLFTQELERLTRDMTIEYKGIRNAYRPGKYWIMEISLELRRNGETYQMSVMLRVWDGKLKVVATSADPDNIPTDLFEDLTNAFVLFFPREQNPDSD